MPNPQHSRYVKLKRSMRTQYLKLLRSPGGARYVAMGFAVGFGLEMMLPVTAYLGYILFYPAVRLSGGSLPAAIIGNIIGKVSLLPAVLLPFGHMLGSWLLPHRLHGIPPYIYGYLKTLMGMTLFAVILGILSYFPVRYLYEVNRKHRLKKSEEKRAAKASVEEL
ncbi:DUF2062 domain-containing protein [Effusibacillus dendaii]|uniref:DUF2062 domain-containing protein n=1 Tax=Effusibacillus dendaii TaxID=2743772 RepID=A0A7I8DEY2_9BACL|nr:DUF2062 domain-containing protein [Effusibacillus dendaii]BCJ87509.1 hypothetical protein skT53_24940 [Effusibacillus dendaii]